MTFTHFVSVFWLLSLWCFCFHLLYRCYLIHNTCAAASLAELLQGYRLMMSERKSEQKQNFSTFFSFFLSLVCSFFAWLHCELNIIIILFHKCLFHKKYSFFLTLWINLLFIHVRKNYGKVINTFKVKYILIYKVTSDAHHDFRCWYSWVGRI